MREIETSNRFYQEGDALYMTATVVTKLDTARPENSQITFILARSAHHQSICRSAAVPSVYHLR